MSNLNHEDCVHLVEAWAALMTGLLMAGRERHCMVEAIELLDQVLGTPGSLRLRPELIAELAELDPTQAGIEAMRV